MIIGWLKKKLLLKAIRSKLQQLDKEGQLNFLKAFFGGSKKATAVLIGIITVLARQLVGLDDEMIQKIIELIMTYIVGQGAVDVSLVLKGLKDK